MAPFPGCPPRTPRRPDTLNCCLVHKHTQQSEPSPQQLSVAWRRPSRSPGELQYSSAQPGTCEYPHTRLASHTLGQSGEVESPAPLQELGSRTGAVRPNPPTTTRWRYFVSTYYGCENVFSYVTHTERERERERSPHCDTKAYSSITASSSLFLVS